MKPWLPSFSFLYQKRPRTFHRRLLKLSPPVILSAGFAALIVLGMCLLKLPFATTQPISWLESLFTAASAVTVTGLVVVDTGATFSGFGITVIALLIQTGGLGFMTFAVLAAVSLGGRVGLKQQMLAKEAMQQTSLASIKTTAMAVLTLALIAEAIAVVAMTAYWLPEKGLQSAFLDSLFYAISGFNSAGFVLSPNGLVDYQEQRFITLLISALFVIGGIGFSVIYNIYEQRRWSQFSVYTKAILLATLVINLLAMLVLWLLEMNNPATIGAMPWYDQAVNSWFQAVTPRSAGFNTLDTSAMTEPSAVFTLLLMFVGGGSMSTAGGIKLGTFIVLILATYTFLRRRDAVTLFGRTIPQDLVMKALAVTVVYLGLIFCGIFALMILNNLPFIDIAFEVLSAAATVGLSRGVTAEVSEGSQLILVFLMFAGRLGPLTLGYFVATPKKRHIRYPETDIQVG
ncbi:MAG: TrkH family potassium uptake protein [Pseudomonadota bacterium]